MEDPLPTAFKSWFLGVFAVFYYGQGFALGSLVLLLPLYMVDQLGLASEARAATISAIIVFPWYIKIIFGIISDNISIMHYGRRKPYLVIATLFSLIGWIALPNYSSVTPFFILTGMSLALGSALGDSVIDGLAVEITPKDRINQVQGVAWGARGIGLGFAGFVSTNLVEQFSWSTMFYTIAVFGVGITIIGLLLPQKQEQTAQSFMIGIKNVAIIFNKFKKHGSLNRVYFFFTTGMVLGLIPLLPFIMDTDFQFSIRYIGYGSLLFSIGNGLGAFFMGILFEKHEGVKEVLTMYIITFFGILFGVVPDINIGGLFGAFTYLVVAGFGLGLFEAYQLKVIQESSPEKIESTAFAFWTGFSNIGQFVFGGAILANLQDVLGVSFIEISMLIIMPLLISYFLLDRIKKIPLKEAILSNIVSDR